MPVPMINYDIVNNGLWQIDEKAMVKKPSYSFLKQFAFGLPEVATRDDFITQNYQDLGLPTLPNQSMKYTDPDLVNYSESFDVARIYPQYYFNEENVDLSDIQNRVSIDEPVSAPWTFEQRATYLLAQKAAYRRAQYDIAIEKMCADLLFTGKYTAKGIGDQESFAPATLRDINVATAWSSNPLKALSDAGRAIFKEGGIRPTTLIMNPVDIDALLENSKISQILDNRRMMLGNINPSNIDDSLGVQYVGQLSLLGLGWVDIYSYSGSYVSEVNGSPIDLIPTGKAYLGTRNIGKIGYCGLLATVAADGGIVQDKIAAKSRATIYPNRRGDTVTTVLQTQQAPAAIISSPAGFGTLKLA